MEWLALIFAVGIPAAFMVGRKTSLLNRKFPHKLG